MPDDKPTKPGWLRRLFSESAAERGAEDDIIERAPEWVRSRLMAEIQRRRMMKANRRSPYDHEVEPAPAAPAGGSDGGTMTVDPGFR